MRPLSGKRINRINLEPIKGESSKILSPFIFGDKIEEIYPDLYIDSNRFNSKVIIGKGPSKLIIIK